MRAISVVLVFLHLSACAGMSSSRDTGPSGTESSACGSAGDGAARSGSSQSFQAADGGPLIAFGAILMLLGLVGTLGTLANCPRAAAAADSTPG